MAGKMLIALEKLRKSFRAEAVNTAFYIRNWLIGKSWTQDKTTYEVVHEWKSNLEHVQVFCSRTYVQKPKHNRDEKFELRAMKGRLIGFWKSHAYRALLGDDCKILEARGLKICKGVATVPDDLGVKIKATNFELLNKDIIFADQSTEKKEGARNEHH